jgi:DNA mismatch endonuclease, patch repair protein
MVDTVTPAVRSRMMAAIKGKNTKPEIIVRKALHAAGFRFRLHDRKLPGRPDVVLAKYKSAVFVHGCFWHGHQCKAFRWPKSRKDFWQEKILRNKARDAVAKRKLRQLGWQSILIWECQIKKGLVEKKVLERLRSQRS